MTETDAFFRDNPEENGEDFFDENVAQEQEAETIAWQGLLLLIANDVEETRIAAGLEETDEQEDPEPFIGDFTSKGKPAFTMHIWPQMAFDANPEEAEALAINILDRKGLLLLSWSVGANWLEEIPEPEITWVRSAAIRQSDSDFTNREVAEQAYKIVARNIANRIPKGGVFPIPLKYIEQVQ
jgi:hypothetical protein